MPVKKTFLNLPEERQKEILDIAIMEFTLNDYKNASLSNIIKKIGLAKGSFYRYFNSKKDLYIYLIEYSMQSRFEEIEDLSRSDITMEEILIQNYRNKIRYDQQYPLYSGFGYRIFREIDNEEVSEIITGLRDKVLLYTKAILEHQVGKGDVKAGSDLDAIAYMIYQNQVGFFEYLSFKFGINYLKNIEEGKPIYSVPEEQIIQSLESFVEILIHGIKK